MPKLPPTSLLTIRTLALRHFQHVPGQVRPVHHHALRHGVGSVLAGHGVVGRDDAARLERRRDDTVDREALPDDMGRAGESRIGGRLVAFRLKEADIVLAIVPDCRGACGPMACAIEKEAGKGS